MYTNIYFLAMQYATVNEMDHKKIIIDQGDSRGQWFFAVHIYSIFYS